MYLTNSQQTDQIHKHVNKIPISVLVGLLDAAQFNFLKHVQVYKCDFITERAMCLPLRTVCRLILVGLSVISRFITVIDSY